MRSAYQRSHVRLLSPSVSLRTIADATLQRRCKRYGCSYCVSGSTSPLHCKGVAVLAGDLRGLGQAKVLFEMMHDASLSCSVRYALVLLWGTQALLQNGGVKKVQLVPVIDKQELANRYRTERGQAGLT
jgi:hypothetical protein